MADSTTRGGGRNGVLAHVAWPGSDALVWASFRTVERGRSAGGFPPRSLARQLLPYRVELSRRRGAGLGVSLGRRSRAGSKREPDSQLLLGTQICISGLESNCEAEVVAEGPGLALPAPSSRGIPSVHGVCMLVYRVFFGTDMCVHDHNALQRRVSLNGQKVEANR